MKHLQILMRIGFVGAVAALAFAAISVASDDSASSVVATYDPGGAAAPPLPVGSPSVEFDPAEDLANVDGSVIVTAESSSVRFIDGGTGEQLQNGPINQRAELRAVSADGTLAALLERRAERSFITVASIDSGSQYRTYDFDGLVEPEAFATDGSLLYVIDHTAGKTHGAYRVRPLDLATGELGVMLGPQKVPIPEEMNGSGRRQIWSPRGDRLYTLYIRQTVHVHSDGEDHPHGTEGTDGFVHVLDLDEEWAFCLHLPDGFGTGELAETAIALDPSGRHLAILDLNAGQLAWASTEELTISQIIDAPGGLDVDQEVHMAVIANHVAIGWGTEVRWFDRDTLTESAEVRYLTSDLKGMTALGNEILAWTDSPEQLAPPKG